MASTSTERRRGRPAGGPPGFALLIVLWSLVLLTLVVGAIGLNGRTETRIAQNLVINAELEAAADGAVYTALFRLTQDAPDRWKADDKARQIDVGGIPVLVAVTDEAGKVNPNLAAGDLLAALLGAVGVPGNQAMMIAQNMVDWRGGAGARPLSTVTTAYRQAGYPYLPQGKPFATLDEVGLVLGMTPEIMDALRPHLSLARQEAPDPRRADAVVAKALGGPSPGELAIPVERAITPVAVTIRATASGPDGGRFVREAVVTLDTRPAASGGYTILDWRAPVTR